MNKEWSLDFLYHGYDDPKFKADMEAVDGLIKRLNELSDSKEKMSPAQAIHDYLALNENFNDIKTPRLIQFNFSSADFAA